MYHGPIPRKSAAPKPGAQEVKTWDYELIIYGKADGIATITLNRPKQLNALNNQTFDEMFDALADAASDAEVRGAGTEGRGPGRSVRGTT